MSRSRLNGSRHILLLAVLSLSLASCGTDAPDRMGGGAAGGAATGATFGLIGGPIGVIVGGAIGGGIGALTAANTTPKQINLGNPPWASGGAPPPAGASQPADLRGRVNQYRAGQEPPSGGSYGHAQSLAPASGSAPGSYGTYSQGNPGSQGNSGVQSQPLPAPSTQ